MDFKGKHIKTNKKTGQQTQNKRSLASHSNNTTSKTKSNDSHEELVSLAIAGNKEAFQQLYKMYYRLVTTIIYQKVSHNDVEDLVQEAFLKAWHSLPNLRRPSRFLPWLLRITHHLCTDLIRSTARKPTNTRIHINLLSYSDDPSRKLSDMEEHIKLLDKLKKLPDKYRLVLTMRFLEGLTPKEIANRLCEPNGTIRNRIFRALHKLDKLLKENNSKNSVP